MLPPLPFLPWIWLIVCSTILTTTTAHASSSHGPDLDAARQNAFHIFNTIHSAMRQWGSSVNHNGVSFFLASIPEGNIFYHGGSSPDPPDSFDWLAFEMEHGYGFALSGPPGGPPPPDKPESNKVRTQQRPELQNTVGSGAQHRLIEHTSRGKSEPSPPSRGYFQTYQATRPLKLIYIDGMGAAKGSWGTTDSQDLLVIGLSRNSTDGPDFGDWFYAELLCGLGKEWGIDGWVRMESGFEIIYCAFTSEGGLELMNQYGTAFPNETAYWQWEIKTFLYEVLRSAAKRYDGFNGQRIQVDWSSMVSAFAYDVNITNPDPNRQDLPRLVGLTKSEKIGIRERLKEVVESRKDGMNPTVDWQSIVDDIVRRFSDRLDYIAHGNLSVEVMWGEVASLLNPFLNYPADTNISAVSHKAVTQCTRHYLDTAVAKSENWTLEDAAIYVAVKEVTNTICIGLFRIRTLLSSSGVAEESALLEGRENAQALMAKLQWTTWKKCGACASSEFCFLPMFPTGNVEDYYSPNCKGLDDIEETFKGCYWALGVPNPSPLCAYSAG